jgi:hypothetical protein
MNVASLPSDANFVEIIVLQDKQDDGYLIALSEDRLLELMGLLSNKHLKHFEKKARCYQKDNLTLENSDNQEIKVYSKHLVHTVTHDKYIVMCYKKEKLPVHGYPSTSEHHNIYEYKRLTFRVHNRVYINFEVQKHRDGSLVRKVFINYNHDNTVDTNFIQDNINQVLSMLHIST